MANVTLDRLDLLPEHQQVACSLTRYDMFTEEARKIICAAGRAQFREFDGMNYNLIYAPKVEVTK